MKTKFLKYTIITLSILLIGGLLSCRKHSPNGELDGFWQIQTVEYISSGDVVSPNPKRYICINLHVIELQIGSSPVLVAGNMQYDKETGTLSLDFPESEFNQPDGDPQGFGIMHPRMILKVRELNSKTLVLESDESIITCRRW